MPKLDFLSKVAFLGSCAILCTGFVFNTNFTWKARQTVTYKRALEILHNHKKAVEHLGEPIKEGKLNFDRSDDHKKFIVNLMGKNTKGQLDCEYIVKEEAKTEIQKVEVKFNNAPNKVFVIYELNSA